MNKSVDSKENDTGNIESKEIEVKKKEQCFVIMPIGDHPSHESGHFKKIYRDLIKPAIEDAGFEAYRADDGGGSQNIQIDIIEKIIQAPMAVCDLSTRNPNVLFELGIRQAFDLPVALIQEVGTERIFDIATFNTSEYRSERIYDEVIADRQEISKLIKTTYQKHKNGDGINSIIRLISTANSSIKSANLNSKELETDDLIKIMFNKINELSKDINSLKYNNIKEIAIERQVYNEKDKRKELLKLLDEVSSPREEKIFRLLSGIDGGKCTVDYVSEIMNMDKKEIINTFRNVKDALEVFGFSEELGMPSDWFTYIDM